MPALPPDPVGSFFQILTGTTGNDQIRGSAFGDLIYGGDGRDVLSGLRGNDYIDGGAGNDIVAGGAGDDTLIGGGGDDTIDTGDGNDLVFGGDGADRINAFLDGGDQVVLYGGAGQDAFALLQASGAFVARLGDFSFAQDSLTINGQGLQAAVAGGVQITAGAGSVAIFLPQLGGTLVLDGVTAQDLVSNLTLSGDDLFTGSDGADVFDGEAGHDQIAGGEGDDVLGGGDGNDLLDGGAGHDTLGGDRGNDTLIGGAGDDAIYGRFGNNQIFGGDGDDLLSSGRDSSTIEGGAGDDVLVARQETGGDHVLTGGAGADTFEFFGARAGRQSDTRVTDFELGLDQFTVNEGDGFAYAADNGLFFQDVAGDALLTLPSGSTIVFEGVTAADMNELIPGAFVS